jgi:hypothetical protein
VNIEETIDSFRRIALELDCKNIVLRQQKDGGEVYEGPGYIRQTPEGALTFKLYVVRRENIRPMENFAARLQGVAGRLYGPDLHYDLSATAHDGIVWTAGRIIPVFNWDTRDESVMAVGQMQSITAKLERPIQPRHHLRLHFFEEYVVPLHQMSQTEQLGSEYMIRDRAEFEGCNCRFEVRVREGSGDTVIEATSEDKFAPAFEARIQESLQYLTGKSAFWRARAERSGDALHVELLSPWRRSSRTQFDPPISRASVDFRKHGWELFVCYLSYVMAHTEGPHWNPVAYHLYNACESSAGSIDAWAVGVSIAVEAVAHLIRLPVDSTQGARVADFQNRMRKYVDAQTDFADLAKRMNGLIGSMGNRRPQDVLHALVKTGHVDKAYVAAWDDLRNRHVHPKPKDLKQPQGVDYQELFDRIHRTEVVLRQLTFYLIGYEGSYTDYGAGNFPSRQFPAQPPVGTTGAASV